MQLPEHAVTLSPAQIAELNRRLSTMRHDIANHLALVVAAAELSRSKPEIAGQMLGTLSQQPARITAALQQFTSDFDATLGIRR